MEVCDVCLEVSADGRGVKLGGCRAARDPAGHTPRALGLGQPLGADEDAAKGRAPRLGDARCSGAHPRIRPRRRRLQRAGAPVQERGHSTPDRRCTKRSRSPTLTLPLHARPPPGGCGHHMCGSCATAWCGSAAARCLQQGAPPRCALPRCGRAVPPQQARQLLEAAGLGPGPAACAAYEAATLIPEEARFTCPYPDCGSFSEIDDRAPPDAPSACPSCGRGVCPTCRCMWHSGLVSGGRGGAGGCPRVARGQDSQGLARRVCWGPRRPRAKRAFAPAAGSRLLPMPSDPLPHHTIRPPSPPQRCSQYQALGGASGAAADKRCRVIWRRGERRPLLAAAQQQFGGLQLQQWPGAGGAEGAAPPSPMSP